MSGLKIEAGLLHGSVFRRLQREMLQASFPKTRLLEAVDIRGLVHAMAGMIEERKPAQARIIRVHDYLWLRLWRGPVATNEQKPVPNRDDVEDMVCSFTLQD
jgi:hypothetical protein